MFGLMLTRTHKRLMAARVEKVDLLRSIAEQAVAERNDLEVRFILSRVRVNDAHEVIGRVTIQRDKALRHIETLEAKIKTLEAASCKPR